MTQTGGLVVLSAFALFLALLAVLAWVLLRQGRDDPLTLLPDAPPHGRVRLRPEPAEPATGTTGTTGTTGSAGSTGPAGPPEREAWP